MKKNEILNYIIDVCNAQKKNTLDTKFKRDVFQLAIDILENHLIDLR